ncbi:MAG: GNAT family N-acetyltransferase [Oscillospiraceae bacterium]|nr:GNAT family N-acetyltransferase [Oscillospiraceae bacterium]
MTDPTARPDEVGRITFRKADSADLPALAGLRMAFLSEVGPKGADAPDGSLRASIMAYFRAAMADGSFVAYVALDGASIVGTSGVSFYGKPPNAGNPTGLAAYVSNMYTLPAYRRMGIAGRLLTLILEAARGRGCGKAYLDATDMGRPIYERRGFAANAGMMELRL